MFNMIATALRPSNATPSMLIGALTQEISANRTCQKGWKHIS